MFLGLLLTVPGLVLATVGVRVAAERPRPASLGGALLAAVGLLVALLGAGRALSPRFFGA
jgi:hypothetical protein